MLLDEHFFSDIIANFHYHVRGRRIPMDPEHMVDPRGGFFMRVMAVLQRRHGDRQSCR